jgi:fructokinase
MRIGIDLGGTKIEGIAIDGGTELLRRRVSTPRDDYAATITAVRDLVASIERELGATCTVGMGIPGALSTLTGLVKNANSTWLIGHPLDRDLERMLARPVRVTNDANCFALSEAVDGAARGARTVFGAILGTGIGGGVVVDGRVLEGRHRIAGEWGHNPLPWPQDGERPGPACYCGRKGCIETFLSGPGLSATYSAITGRRAEAAAIATLADAGDPGANDALAVYETTRAGTREYHQRARSGHHRPRRRRVQHIPAVRPGAAAAEAVRFFGFSRYTNGSRPPWRFERCTRRGVVVAVVRWWVVGGWR